MDEQTNPASDTADADPEATCCGRRPRSEEEVELNRRLRGLKSDPLGAFQLGRDGVMRSFTADRDIIDAVGLSPKHIEIWFERMMPQLREIFGEETYQGVDGTTVPMEKMFQWGENIPPPPIPKEEQEAARRRMMEEEEERRKKEEEDGKEVGEKDE